MPTRYPKQARTQKMREDLQSHLIGYHGLFMTQVRYKSYADLKTLHDSVKPEGVRWCAISHTTTKRS